MNIRILPTGNFLRHPSTDLRDKPTIALVNTMTSYSEPQSESEILPDCLLLERPATPEQTRAIRHAVQQYLLDLKWPPDTVYEVTLAVGEAINNAVSYGTAHLTSTVALCVRLVHPNHLLVEVRNRGTFKADVAELSCLPDGLPTHGRGFALMSRLMDTVQVATDGAETIVRLSKHLVA